LQARCEPPTARWRRRSGLQQQGLRAVVDQLDGHVRAEGAALCSAALAEELIQRLGQLGPRRCHEARAIAPPWVAVERELAHAKGLARAPRPVHFASFIWPAAAGNPRRARILAARRSAAASSSSCVTPSSTSRPGPISASSSPCTRTPARLTLCTSARICVEYGRASA